MNEIKPDYKIYNEEEKTGILSVYFANRLKTKKIETGAATVHFPAYKTKKESINLALDELKKKGPLKDLIKTVNFVTVFRWLKDPEIIQYVQEIEEIRIDLLNGIELSQIEDILTNKTVANAKCLSELGKAINNLRFEGDPGKYNKNNSITVNNNNLQVDGVELMQDARKLLKLKDNKDK